MPPGDPLSILKYIISLPDFGDREYWPWLGGWLSATYKMNNEIIQINIQSGMSSRYPITVTERSTQKNRVGQSIVFLIFNFPLN